jgi:hypothetical protein
MDIEAELASEQESTSDLDSELTEFTELSEEEIVPHFPNLPAWEHPGTVHDEYDGASSEQSENPSVTTTKSKTPSRQEYREKRLEQEEHERTLRLKNRDRAREERKALYTRFGLTVEEAEGDRNDAHEEERRSSKRQKRDVSPLEVSSESQPQHKPPVLKQTTLNFNKVGKSRRLFSRKESSQNEKEEAEVVFLGAVRRYPKRTSIKRQDYRTPDMETWDRWLLEQFRG